MELVKTPDFIEERLRRAILNFEVNLQVNKGPTENRFRDWVNTSNIIVIVIVIGNNNATIAIHVYFEQRKTTHSIRQSEQINISLSETEI